MLENLYSGTFERLATQLPSILQTSSQGVSHVTHKACEAPRPQGGASRRGSFVRIVPLDPAYKAGLAGHLPVKKPLGKGWEVRPTVEFNATLKYIDHRALHGGIG